MMSDSDDTDVLLLIPPDLFLVPSSSNSDASSVCAKGDYSSGKVGVISELVGHMQSLETRISVIESKDNSLDATLLNRSLDLQIDGGIATGYRQTLPKTRFSVSQCSSLQNTPIKPGQSLSVPSTPSGYSSSNHTNFWRNDMKSMYHFPAVADTNANNTNGNDKSKHDTAMSYSHSSMVPSAFHCMGHPHVCKVSSKQEPHSQPIDYSKSMNKLYINPHDQMHSMLSTSTLPSVQGQSRSYSKASVQEMEIAEVDELLQEMEATEIELSKRINNTSVRQYIQEHSNKLPSGQVNDTLQNEEQDICSKYSTNRRLDFSIHKPQSFDGVPVMSRKNPIDIFPDISLPYNESFQTDETDKIISEFKPWEQSVHQSLKTDKHKNEEANQIAVKSVDDLSDRSIAKAVDVKRKESVIEQNTLNMDDIGASTHNGLVHPLHKNIDIVGPSELSNYNIAPSSKHAEYKLSHSSDVCKSSQQNGNMQLVRETRHVPSVTCTAHASTNTDFLASKTQRILSLSDFWDSNTNKSQEEMLRIKLEEEKFRREHCEHLIQELQKRLLEQQEKVAVALRVDNEKNDLIAQFQSAWAKLKQRVNSLETDHGNLQKDLENVMQKNKSEIADFQAQIKRCEGELSKAIDLAAGYKDKSDGLIKERVDLLKTHADELESYKSLVQEAENRCEELKGEYNKLFEKNQQTEETLKNIQQELGKERLKGGEVRNEMNVIHKALDTCEAELTILRQEKENFQLKLKEEVNRNNILEQKNIALLSLMDDAKKAEKLAKDEIRSLAEQKEKIRSDLQEVYQKQVDEVVKAKLQEFQTQLDAAETEFLEELKTRQQVIAECAAKKIKDVIDKHRLEINLLEEKHKEEKRLCELQLAQVAQKSSVLEMQLNSQRTTKSHLAEQLHSVMQKQWQQALQIISGGSLENLTPLQRIHAEKFFEAKGPRKSESMPNCYTKLTQEPMRLTVQGSETKNLHCGLEEQNETMSTVSTIEDTPLTRKETKNDLRKYMKMIAEIQQPRDEFFKVRDNSPPSTCREVPRKHYMKKELSIMSEDSITWQPVSEASANDLSEYIPISQKLLAKPDYQKNKQPPWK